MTLLSNTELHELIETGVINAKHENVNGSSIDITLHNTIKVEERPDKRVYHAIKAYQKEPLVMYDYPIYGSYCMVPGEFILASSEEIFNLPLNISAEYKLKSSMARIGLEHLNAGWCDPGWSNSRLTLELKNMTRYHGIDIEPGMKIGQIVFFKHAPVPEHESYKVKGQYNNQTTVTAKKELR